MSKKEGKIDYKNLTEEEKKELRKKKKEEKKRKKAEKKRKREEMQRKHAQQQQAPKVTWEEKFSGKKQFGELPIMMSESAEKTDLTDMDKINLSMDQKVVTIRARIHTKRKKGKDMAFLLLRDGYYTIQAIVQTSKDKKTIPRAMVKFSGSITNESIVEITGLVVKVAVKTKTSQCDVEIQVQKIYLFVSSQVCPLLIEDAMKSDAIFEKQIEKDKQNKKNEKKEGKEKVLIRDVAREVRLTYRYLDLRAPAHKAIFKLQSAVGMFFRKYLYSKNFMEIHSPKIISTASEGGTDVFELKYFNKKAYLAQSPQLYKQMGIMCDFDRVFEIGPVFRAEKHFTNRHLTEFTGLDLEMKIKNHYHEILETLDELFIYIFEGLKKMEKELKIIYAQYPFKPLEYNPKKNLVLTYKEGVKMLREAGVKMGDYEDLGTPEEKLLGKLVKEKYKTDFYILDKYPMDCRPFYTMPDPKDPKYSNSYDLFIRGEEITSGAQRIHDPKFLLEKAKEKGVELSPIQDYVDSFKYGAWPHGGAGIGLERVVMLYLGLPNIRKCTMFPRDPKRVTP